jgi:hypothetical protein
LDVVIVVDIAVIVAIIIDAIIIVLSYAAVSAADVSAFNSASCEAISTSVSCLIIIQFDFVEFRIYIMYEN